VFGLFASFGAVDENNVFDFMNRVEQWRKGGHGVFGDKRGMGRVGHRCGDFRNGVGWSLTVQVGIDAPK